MQQGFSRCALLWLCLCLVGCSAGRPQVVVYCALDQIYSQPLLQKFEQSTGIRVLAKYDLEATKTTGLVQRLRAERGRPRCDVFWNNEIVQTVRLQQEGLLQPVVSTLAAGIPAAYKDPEGHWFGFAGRLRVLIYNKQKMPTPPPARLGSLLDKRWRAQVGMARPLFGTTLTHCLALHQVWGDRRYEEFLQGLQENQVAMLDGNSLVKDRVASGQLLFGLTDSDDAYSAMLEGAAVDFVVPEEGGLLIPNTVCLLAGAPHRSEGLRLVDFLISAETEQTLAQGRSLQIPLRSGPPPPPIPAWDKMKLLQVDWQAAARGFERDSQGLRQRFLQ